MFILSVDPDNSLAMRRATEIGEEVAFGECNLVKIPLFSLASIDHKSLEICDQCRLWQQNGPASGAYVLASSLDYNGTLPAVLQINASNVTVDLDGNSITYARTGAATQTVGISAL
jgi:hypothetical protein